MAKQGTEFELFVKAIYEEILQQDDIENVKVEHGFFTKICTKCISTIAFLSSRIRHKPFASYY